MRFRRRSFGLQLTVLCIAGIVVLARYWFNVGFDQKYRQLIANELARYGLGAEIGRMTLDPVDGLTAKDVELFDLKSPEQRLAGINRITLDIDLAKLMNKEEFLRSITLTRAHLSLPVDPADPDSEWIRVKDLNARLIIKGREIEIAQAEADMSGIRVTVRGEVTRGPDDNKPPDPEAEKRKRDQQLREMRDRRGALRSVLRLLEKFNVPADAAGVPRVAYKANVELEVHGDLSDLDRASVRATMQGGPLRCGNFIASEYSADAILEDGELTVRRLNVRDASGTFSASASWKVRESEAVDFAVDSSVDLLALARGVWPEMELPEDLAISAPPRFHASGLLHAGRPFTLSRLPLDVTGAFTASAFEVKGESYQRLHADFAVRDDGYLYLRNVEAVHQNGTMRGQFMRRAEEMRYECQVDAGMAALKPLLDLPAVATALQPVKWTPQSHLTASFSGESATDGKSWDHRGTMDARDYRLRGSLVRQFKGNIEVGPGALPVITVKDFLARREDGDLAGKIAVIDQQAQLLRVTGITSSCMPAPAASMFNAKTAEAISRYYFEAPPRVELDGTIGLRSPLGNDLKVKLTSPGVCGLPVGNQNWRFSGVAGSLHLKKDLIHIELAGRCVPRQLFTTTVRFDEAAPMDFSGDFGLLKENAVSATRYTVKVNAKEGVKLLLSDVVFPIGNLDASVRTENGRLTVTANGELYDGRLGAVVDFPDVGKSEHHATVAIDRVDFSKLTALFGSNDETGGALTGRFTYKTPDGNGATIEGSGSATLEEGNIFALPLLGPLSVLISALLPGDRIAYSVARKATATFRASRGRVTMNDFEAATRTFRLTASGVIDIVRDAVDVDARINLRGVPGLLLYPVSKLIEYHAGGTMSQPGWRPKILSGSSRRRNGAGGTPDEPEQ